MECTVLPRKWKKQKTIKKFKKYRKQAGLGGYWVERQNGAMRHNATLVPVPGNLRRPSGCSARTSRLDGNQERDRDEEDDMYNGNICSSRASIWSPKNQTTVNSKHQYIIIQWPKGLPPCWDQDTVLPFDEPVQVHLLQDVKTGQLLHSLVLPA